MKSNNKFFTVSERLHFYRQQVAKLTNAVSYPDLDQDEIDELNEKN